MPDPSKPVPRTPGESYIDRDGARVTSGADRQSKPVPLEAVEAVARTIQIKAPRGVVIRIGDATKIARAAILAADEARGMKVEKRIAGKRHAPLFELEQESSYRLVSAWIKGPVDE